MTRLTRETALALMPMNHIEPNMCRMMLVTMARMTTAAQTLNPVRSVETTNTATEREEGERGREGEREGGKEGEGRERLLVMHEIHH